VPPVRGAHAERPPHPTPSQASPRGQGGAERCGAELKIAGATPV